MIAESLLRLGYANVAALSALVCAISSPTGRGAVLRRCARAPIGFQNDGPGQFIFLAGEVYRYTTRDRTLLTQMCRTSNGCVTWSACGYACMGTVASAAVVRPACMISHEGYSAKPDACWDDLWALKGPTLVIAAARDRLDDERRFIAAARRSTPMRRSLRAATALHRIDISRVRLSSAISIGVVYDRVYQRQVRATFRRAHRTDVRRYWRLRPTPQRLCAVGSIHALRAAQRRGVPPAGVARACACSALQFFTAARRPPAWNQWPEVVARDARKRSSSSPTGWRRLRRSVLDRFAYSVATARCC
jgi:hypothetical protein